MNPHASYKRSWIFMGEVSAWMQQTSCREAWMNLCAFHEKSWIIKDKASAWTYQTQCREAWMNPSAPMNGADRNKRSLYIEVLTWTIGQILVPPMNEAESSCEKPLHGHTKLHAKKCGQTCMPLINETKSSWEKPLHRHFIDHAWMITDKVQIRASCTTNIKNSWFQEKWRKS